MFVTPINTHLKRYLRGWHYLTNRNVYLKICITHVKNFYRLTLITNWTRLTIVSLRLSTIQWPTFGLIFMRAESRADLWAMDEVPNDRPAIIALLIQFWQESSYARNRRNVETFTRYRLNLPCPIGKDLTILSADAFNKIRHKKNHKTMHHYIQYISVDSADCGFHSRTK
jgi:hypothetical protein